MLSRVPGYVSVGPLSLGSHLWSLIGSGDKHSQGRNVINYLVTRWGKAAQSSGVARKGLVDPLTTHQPEAEWEEASWALPLQNTPGNNSWMWCEERVEGITRAKAGSHPSFQNILCWSHPFRIARFLVCPTFCWLINYYYCWCKYASFSFLIEV